MKPILYYLIQVIAASGILYGYYHFFLRNKKFHRYNRFYLLAISIVSMLIPFLNIPVYFTNEEANSSVVIQTLKVISFKNFHETTAPSVMLADAASTNWFTWGNILYLFYILIAVIAFARIIYSLRKIKSIIKNNPVEKIDSIHFVNTEEPGTPFSFFNWLFWNRKIELKSSKGEKIFRHELFHIQEKHSLDIFFVELLTVVFWINPFFHLIKKELKTIHEFLADEAATEENDRWEYAELLLMQVMNTKIHLTNPFFHNQVKRRIAMITSSSKSRDQYLRKLIVLPFVVLVFAIFAFNYKNKESDVVSQNFKYNPNNRIDTLPEKIRKNQMIFLTKQKIGLQTDTIIFHKEGTPAKDFDLNNVLVVVNGKKENYDYLTKKTIISEEIHLFERNNSDAVQLYGEEATAGVISFKKAKIIDMPSSEYYKEEFEEPKSVDTKIFEKAEIEPFFQGGEQALRKFLERNLDLNIPQKNGASSGTYTVWIQFIVDKEGNLSDFVAKTKNGYGMEEEVIKAFKLSPKWEPAIQNGHKVTAYKNQTVTFVVIED